jgi:predicted site-specific integrase-resolvase
MKSNEVKKILGITQKTLSTWIKEGKIHPIKVSGTRNIYDDAEVYSLVGKGKIERKTVAYLRITENDTKEETERQKQSLIKWADENGYKIDLTLSDVGYGYSLEQRPELSSLMKMATQHEIGTVIVENKNILFPFGYEIFEFLFNHIGVKIVTVTDTIDKTYENKLTEEIKKFLRSYKDVSYEMKKKMLCAELAIDEN